MSYRYYAIVPDTNGERILMLREAGGWSLPYFDRDRWVIWQVVDYVNQEIKSQLGIDVTTLRCLRIVLGSPPKTDSPVYVMENHSPDWEPPSRGRWFSQDQLPGLELAVPEHRAIIDEWFATFDQKGPPPAPPPWYVAGWFLIASTSMSDEMSRIGITATGPAEQLRSSERSSVLKARTDTGHVYFKAVPDMFRYEPALTRALSDRFPGRISAVLAVDADSRIVERTT